MKSPYAPFAFTKELKAEQGLFANMRNEATSLLNGEEQQYISNIRNGEGRHHPITMPSLHQAIHAINKSTYKLDMSGVVGMLGGNNAADAHETIHLFAGRRWMGWYNYAGGLTVARRFGQIARSRLWDSIFPGADRSVVVTFKLGGKAGLEYAGTYSGTKLRTKYLGYLIAEACKNYPSMALQLFKKDRSEARKTGSSAEFTIISLPPRQSDRVRRSLTATTVSATKEKHELIPVHPIRDHSLALWAIAPSLISVLAVIFSLIGEDPLCASLILLGILSSGLSSLALGSATLRIRVPVPSAASPPGDGLIFPDNGSIIVLEGDEADVNIVTKGDFELDYAIGMRAHPRHDAIGISSLLLMAQFVVQLLFIPRCTFFGQILFLVSFVASGLYHLFVVSHEREQVHRELLLQELSMRMQKRRLGTRTQMAVFVCLVLGSGRENPSSSNYDAVLSRILPNETPVWKYWRRKVLWELEHFWKRSRESSGVYTPSIQMQPEDQTEKVEYSHFAEEDTRLLEDLIDDAWCVFNGFPEWRDGASRLWWEQGDHAGEKVCSFPGGSPV